MKHKLKSKSTFRSAKAITFFLVLFSLFSYSQTIQKPLWSVPDQKIIFSSGVANLTDLTLGGGNYIGNYSALNAHNAISDKDGNLLFFVADENGSGVGNVYDGTAKLIGQILDGNSNTCSTASEIAIVPVPGDCQKFYIISSQGNPFASSLGTIALFYSVLDLSQTNPVTGAHGVLIDINTSNSIADNAIVLSSFGAWGTGEHPSLISIAVTPIKANNTRILFANVFSNICTFEISQSGISTLNSPIFNGSSLGGNDVYSSEMEVIAISGGYRLAFSNKIEVIVGDFDANGVLTASGFKTRVFSTGKFIHGLEFSPNGGYLYIAHELTPYLEYCTATSTTLSTPAAIGMTGDLSSFANGQIELAPYSVGATDNTLYFSGNGVLSSLKINTSGAAITPLSTNWGSNSISLNYVSPLLNDQIDGDVYFPATPTISGNAYACGTATETYTLGGSYSPTVIYNWTIAGGTPTSFTTYGTASSLPITWTATSGQANGGTITVTPQGAGGCSTPAIFTVNGCCRQPIVANKINVYLNNVTRSTTTNYSATINAGNVAPPFSTFVYTINGAYTLNSGATVTFTGCQVYLSDNAQININGGGYLKLLSGTKLQAGCGDMWNGIVINDGTPTKGNLLVEGSTIQDAKLAIDSKNGAPFTVQASSILNLNYNGILMEAYSSGTHPGVFQKSTISCAIAGNPTNTLLPPYSIANGYSGRSNYGIGIVDVNQANIGLDASSQGNTFNYLDFGIKNINSGLRLYNNTFTNITEAPYGTGYCIHSVNTLSPEKLLVVGGSSNVPYQQNTFNNSFTGVLASDNQDVTVNTNTFNNLTTAVSVQNCTGAGNAIYVQSNIIDDCNNGIYSLNCGGSQTLDISLNNINSSTCSANCKPYSKAITITNSNLSTSGTAPAFTILNNTIKRVSTGIEVGNYTYPKIRDNTITSLSDLTGSGPQSNGIYATNCPQLDVENNLVKGSSGSAWWENGIRVEPGCTNTLMLYNGIEDIGRGLFFSGTLTGTKVSVNNMKNNYDGLLLNAAIIGDQLGTSGSYQSSENTWQGTFGNSHLYSNNSDGSQSKMNFLNSGVTGWTADMFQYNTIISTASGIYNPITPLPCSTRSPYWGPAHRGMLSNDKDQLIKIAKNKFHYPIYDEASKWWAKYSLYNMLMADSSIQSDAPDLQTFADSISLSNMGKLYQINRSVNHDNSNPVLISALINSIVGENAIEQNMKEVYDIIISKENNDSLNSDEIAKLKVIAQLCPYESGPGVYNARALLSNIDNNINYTNECEIVKTKGRKMEQEAKSSLNPNNLVAIFPNPANEKLNINVHFESGQTGILTVYDLTGKVVLSKALTENTEVSTTSLSEGIYIYKINVDSSLVNSGKLSIIH